MPFGGKQSEHWLSENGTRGFGPSIGLQGCWWSINMTNQDSPFLPSNVFSAPLAEASESSSNRCPFQKCGASITQRTNSFQLPIPKNTPNPSFFNVQINPAYGSKSKPKVAQKPHLRPILLLHMQAPGPGKPPLHPVTPAAYPAAPGPTSCTFAGGTCLAHTLRTSVCGVDGTRRPLLVHVASPVACSGHLQAGPKRRNFVLLSCRAAFPEPSGCMATPVRTFRARLLFCSLGCSRPVLVLFCA